MVPMIAILDGLSADRPRARLKEAPRRGGKTGPAEAYFAQTPPVRAHPLPFGGEPTAPPI
jgi:hypothetical protein